MDDILKGALERFEESQTGSDYNRETYEEDVRFSRLGEQWPDRVKKQRIRENRPVLTINKLPAFIRQVVNDARQNKPGIRISPIDSGADVNTAKVIGGLIRSIERGSKADVAYDTAIDHAVSGGFGFFRIGIDYAHEDSFDLEARIQRIPNPLMVHWDVSSTEFDASDWNYAFVSDFLDEGEFERLYPNAQKASFDAGSRGNLNEDWLDGDRVRVAEYFERTEAKRNLILLTNGQAIREDMLPNLARSSLQSGGLDIEGISDEEAIRTMAALTGIDEAQRREVTAYEVKRYILSGTEVLEEDVWPGSRIPICPVWGEEVYSDGRRYFRSMIRDARDPQTMVNFWRSASTELVALAPRAPFIGKAGFIPEGEEEKWETANTRSHAYLEYQGDAAPQRQPFAGVPAGAIQESLNASDDMKAIIGIYDSSLGARSNETSGRAIMARQREADVSNYHFMDNLNRAIRYAGEVLVEIIPAVYGARQAVRILGEDFKEEVANLTMQDGGSVDENGKPSLYNLTVGKYDVSVDTGPSYQSQREEAREILIEIARQVPGSAEVLGDIMMRNFDFVGADEAAERLKSLYDMKYGGAMPQGMPGVPGLPVPEGTPQGPSGDVPVP